MAADRNPGACKYQMLCPSVTASRPSAGSVGVRPNYAALGLNILNRKPLCSALLELYSEVALTLFDALKTTRIFVFHLFH